MLILNMQEKKSADFALKSYKGKCKCYLDFPKFRRNFQVQFYHRKSTNRGQIVIWSGL